MTYRFDDFALDVGTRRLLRHDQEVHLSPKALDLLAVLIENRAKAISKTDLLERLWPSTYVADTNLAGLVAEIRRALADSADDPRYIGTVRSGSATGSSGKFAMTPVLRSLYAARQILARVGDAADRAQRG